MYLVLSALTSSPISLVAATKASAFSFRVCKLPPSTLTSNTKTSQLKNLVKFFHKTKSKWEYSKIGAEQRRKNTAKCKWGQ